MGARDVPAGYPQGPTYNGGQPIEYDYQATYPPGDRLAAVDSYRTLWDSVNGAWEENPWVWVVEFRRC